MQGLAHCRSLRWWASQQNATNGLRCGRDGRATAGVAIAGGCLDGPSLADRASSFDYDVALIASDLHRLSAEKSPS